MTTALIVSDLHIGSTVAVMPPEVHLGPTRTREERKVCASDLQCEFYDRWCETIAAAGRVDCCFVLGDSVDGIDHKSDGYTVWTTDRRAQADTAYTLLSMVKTSKYYCVQGTRYHVDDNTTADLAIADKLGATFGTDLVVNLDGVRIHLNHKIGHSRSPASKLTAPATEIAHACVGDPVAPPEQRLAHPNHPRVCGRSSCD